MADSNENSGKKLGWSEFVQTGVKGAEATGYVLKRVPGEGLSSVFHATKDGKTVRASIRTTNDRWFAFQPLDGGKKWKTLSGVDLVIIASVDAKHAPKAIQVYIFPAAEVRKRFDAAYAARVKAGQSPKDSFGFWIGLDKGPSGTVGSIGSGIVDSYQPVAQYPIESLSASPAPAAAGEEAGEGASAQAEPASISEVMKWARERLAKIAGVDISAVRLELKMEC